MRDLRTDLDANVGAAGGVYKRKKLAGRLRKIHLSGETVSSTHLRGARTAGPRSGSNRDLPATWLEPNLASTRNVHNDRQQVSDPDVSPRLAVPPF